MATNKSATATSNAREKVNNAMLPNVQALIAAGINPKNGLPYKSGIASTLFKDNNKKLLRIIDEQDAINSIRIRNLPNGLSSELVERILYYRGQGMFFYIKTDDRFYFLPYALNGTIDVYGRYVRVTPLPYGGGTASLEEKKKQQPWIEGLTRKVAYDLHLDSLTLDDLDDTCVLLHDYSPQMAQTIIPRQQLNDPLLDVMADMIPFMRTALLNGTGIEAMRVASEDEESNVAAASQTVNHAALAGEKFIAVVGKIDFQTLTAGPVSKAEEYMMAMQSLDNYRLSTHGISNGGLFQKKAHMLQDEQNMNVGRANSVIQDRLNNRQRFCDLVNSIWGLGLYPEIAEGEIGIDRNLDGEAVENQPEAVGEVGDMWGGEEDA